MTTMTYHWINKPKARFYRITMKGNGSNILLNYQWGSIMSNRGGKKSLLLCSEQEAKSTIEQMIKRRKSRGYELLFPTIH